MPGVHGIGEKGAAKLIAQFGTLEGIYEHIDDVKNEKQKAALLAAKGHIFLSRDLVTIKTDIKLAHPLNEFVCQPDYATANPDLLALFKEMEFRSLASKVEERIASRGTALHKPHSVDEVAASPKQDAATSSDVASTEAETDPAKSNDNYTLVKTSAKFDLLCRVLKEAKEFTFDTETTGLDITEDKPIGMSFSTAEGKAFYIPLVAKHLADLTPEDIIEGVKPFFADTKKTKTAHNLKFDLQMLANIGISASPPFGDTMLASYVVDATAREHGLDALSLKLFNHVKIKTTTLIGEDKKGSMLAADLQALSVYACEDADYTWRLKEALLPQVAAVGGNKVYSEVEMPLVPVLAQMERDGIFVDSQVLSELSAELYTLGQKLEKSIYELADEEFNINSTKQLAKILFEKMAIHEKLGIKRLKKTQSGYSTDVSVLEKLSAHPLPRAILEYRSVTKLKGTYVDALPQLISPHTGRLHTSFHQTGTATGRLSSSDPNLQNIPIRTEMGRQIRKAFRAEKPGQIIISADYSQIELRLLAHIAEEKALAEAFRAGLDIHTATASRIFNVPVANMTSELRSRAKAINFGIIYGMGPQRLARTTGVTMAEAKDFIERYFTSYPGIAAFIDEAIAKARRLGYSETMMGRRRPIPELQSKDPMVLANGENIAVNSPIQGSAADLIKLAMIKLAHRLKIEKLKTRMLLQVHDELVFEGPLAELEQAKTAIIESMENAMSLTVPLKVEVGHGKDWLEAH